MFLIKQTHTDRQILTTTTYPAILWPLAIPVCTPPCISYHIQDMQAVQMLEVSGNPTISDCKQTFFNICYYYVFEICSEYKLFQLVIQINCLFHFQICTMQNNPGFDNHIATHFLLLWQKYNRLSSGPCKLSNKFTFHFLLLSVPGDLFLCTHTDLMQMLIKDGQFGQWAVMGWTVDRVGSRHEHWAVCGASFCFKGFYECNCW